MWLHGSLQDRSGLPNDTWGLLDKAFLLVFVLACVNGIFLTAFYWAVLYVGGSITADNLFRHGLNALLMIGEIFVSRVPICTYHLQVLLGWLKCWCRED